MATKRTTRSSARAALAANGQSQLTEYFNVRSSRSATQKSKNQPSHLKKAVVAGHPVASDDFSKEVTPEQSLLSPKCQPKAEDLVLSPVKKQHTPITSPTRLNAKRALFQDEPASPASSSKQTSVLESVTKETARRRLVNSSGRPLAMSPLKTHRKPSPDPVRCSILSPSKATELKLLPRRLLDDDEEEDLCEPGPSRVSFISPSPRKKARTEDGSTVEDTFAGDNKKYGNLEKLTKEVRISSKMTLPKKFSNLYDMFRHMERIVSISFNMGKRLVFDEIRADVEKNLKRAFSKELFAQLLYVYPESYNVRLEARRHCRGVPQPTSSGQTSEYDYVIEPNLKDDTEGFLRRDLPKDTRPVPLVSPTKLVSPLKSPRKAVMKAIPQQREAILDHRPRLEGWRMQCRLYILKHKMIMFVKNCYKSHLENCGLALSLSDLADLRQFDSDFDLESVDDIPLADLPQPPKSKSSYDEFMKRVIKENPSGLLHGKTKDIFKETPALPEICTGSSAPVPPKKMSLLERIKAKESAKKASEHGQTERKVLTIRRSRLQDMVKHNVIYNLEQVFRVKNRLTLSVQEVITTLARSCNVSTGEMMERLNLIVEIANNLLEFANVAGSNVKNLRWKTATRSLEDLLATINTEIKKISESLSK